MPEAGAAIVGAGRAPVVVREAAKPRVGLVEEAFLELHQRLLHVLHVQAAELCAAQGHRLEGHGQEARQHGLGVVVGRTPLRVRQTVRERVEARLHNGPDVGVARHAERLGEGVDLGGVQVGRAHEVLDALLDGAAELLREGAGLLAVREEGEDCKTRRAHVVRAGLTRPAAVRPLLRLEPAQGAHHGGLGLGVAAEVPQRGGAGGGGAGVAEDALQHDGGLDVHDGVDGVDDGRGGGGGGDLREGRGNVRRHDHVHREIHVRRLVHVEVVRQVHRRLVERVVRLGLDDLDVPQHLVLGGRDRADEEDGDEDRRQQHGQDGREEALQLHERLLVRGRAARLAEARDEGAQAPPQRRRLEHRLDLLDPLLFDFEIGFRHFAPPSFFCASV